MFIRSVERLDEPGKIAEPGSSDRARRSLRYDQPGATFEKPEPGRSFASPSSSSSSASTQLPGAGCEKGPGSSAAADAEQAVDPAAEAGQHQLPQAERLADPRSARPDGAGRTGPRAGGPRARPRAAASASADAHAALQHAAEPSSVELRAGCCHGPRWSFTSQPGSQWLQAATAIQTKNA